MPYDLFSILGQIDKIKSRDIQLLKYTHSAISRSSYKCRRIKLEPPAEFDNYLVEIKKRIDIAIIKKYQGIEEYKGMCMNGMVYQFKPEDDLLQDFSLLMGQISNPETIIEAPNERDFNAQIICGDIQIAERLVPIKLISIRKPVTISKKSFWDRNAFVIKDLPVLNFAKEFEVIILGNSDIFFMNADGEKLFNLERSFKILGKKRVDSILEMEFVSNKKVFEEYATLGRCPRRLMSYNRQTAEKIKTDEVFREKMARVFGFGYQEESKRISIETKEDVEKMVDILCGRATTDYFDNNRPVQIEGKRDWGSRI